MKKLIYFIVVLGITLTSCNPVEDINNEIDAQSNPVMGEANFTLSSDDYAGIIEQGEDEPVDSYENFESFNTVDDAKIKISAILANKFPYWGEGSSANVTFNLYESISIQSEESYTVSSQDYVDSGFNYGNFSNEEDFAVFLAFKYPNAERGDLVELTYQWWAPGAETRTDKFILFDSWIKTSQFSEDEYAFMGQGYPNFSDEDEAIFKIGIYLESLYPFAQAGDNVVTLYELYNSSGPNENIIAPFTFDGDVWNVTGSVTEQSIKFGFINNVWVPDNTIRYTLVGDDYNYISAQLLAEDGFASPAANLGEYGSFTTEAGNSNQWTEDMLLVAFDILLDNIAPGADEGQQYVLSYKIYNGSTVSTQEKSFIKTGGEWIINN